MDTNSGWGAVLAGGGWPAIGLLATAFGALIVRGPTFMRMIGREWKQEAAKDRQELDDDRDKLTAAKDKEFDRISKALEDRDAKIERLYARIGRLMKALYYWREQAQNYFRGWSNERQLHQSYERINKIEVLNDLGPIEQPERLVEADDAEMFMPGGRG